MQAQADARRVGSVVTVGFMALLICCLFSGGCSVGDPEVTIGRNFPIERLAAVKKGMSTKKQVEELLGKPYKIQKLEGRREKWRYYSREEAVQRVLLVIPTKTFVNEHELLITFDGPFVDQIEKQSNSFTE